MNDVIKEKTTKNLKQLQKTGNENLLITMKAAVIWVL